MSKLLFLDFDGVLHPNFCPAQNHFSRTDFLMEAISECSGTLEVAISSSWRFHYSLDEILSYLPKALRDQISGATPEVEPGRHQRYREINAYLTQYKEEPDWRALDDDLAGFPKGCPELIVCDGRVGIDSECVLSLRTWMAAPSNRKFR